jgi:hypothetical protein
LAKEGTRWTSKLILTLLWLNFIALWIRVYRITTESDVKDSLYYLGSIISAYGLLVAAWIFHNIRIYEKKEARKSTRLVTHNPIQDALQSYISVSTDLQQTQEIVVTVTEGKKRFADGTTTKERIEQPGVVATRTN